MAAASEYLKSKSIYILNILHNILFEFQRNQMKNVAQNESEILFNCFRRLILTLWNISSSIYTSMINFKFNSSEIHSFILFITYKEWPSRKKRTKCLHWISAPFGVQHFFQDLICRKWIAPVLYQTFTWKRHPSTLWYDNLNLYFRVLDRCTPNFTSLPHLINRIRRVFLPYIIIYYDQRH